MKHIIATIIIVALLIQTLEGQQCTSNQFRVKNNDGDDYLVINSPTEVKTCGGINICDAITEGKQSLSLNDGQLSISAANSVQLPDKSDTNEIQSLSLQNGQLSISNGNAVLLPDVSDQNEIQNLSIQSGQLSISNGNTVTLPDVSDTNEIQSLSIQSGQLIISGNGGNSVTLPDADPTNEIQNLTLQGGLLSISKGNSVQIDLTLKLQNGQLSVGNGNSIQLPDANATNELQNLTLQNGQLSISNGNTVTLPDVSDTNEIQNLSIQSRQLSISNGNSVTLPDADPTNEIQSLSLQNGALSLSKDSATVDTMSLKTFLAFSVRIPTDTAYAAQTWGTAPFSDVAWITFPANSYNKVTKSFTPPYTGYYRFNLRGFMDTSSTNGDRYYFYWNVNDDGVYHIHCGGYIGSLATPISNCNYVMPLNATDTVRVQLYSTIAITLGSSSQPSGTQFEWQGEYMGPL